MPNLLAAPTVVSKNGIPEVSIIHAAEAHEEIEKTAGELASILGRMTGGEFEVRVGGEPQGIVLGTIAEFPGVPGGERFQPDDLLKQEEYIIRTDGEKVWLIGASVAGASHAAWDFLFRLGFRQYFPGADWEIIPSRPDLVADFDIFEAPDYYVRRFAWHFGNWPEFREETVQWTSRNRLSNRAELPGTFLLYTSHIYGAIINANREEVEANPGICSIVDGRRTSKLNPANPRTLELVETFVTEYFEKHPDRASISMDPSDGGGWGTSPEELAIGTPSDRTVFLANYVAKFINEKFGQKYVGIYSYNEHSPAPRNVRVHPNIIVSVATSFIHGGYTVEELMKEWREAGAEMMGIREYHSVVAWDLARPTGGRATNLNYLAKTIPAFYELGARFYITEAGPNWGPQGFGNYFTTRALWDVKEAANLDSIMDEFLINCFPEAREPMERFYGELLHPSRSRSLSEDFAGRMYRTLQEARQMTKDPAALRRLDALTLYARYAELLMRYQNSRSGPPDLQSQTAADLMSFAYRIKDSQMVNSYALIRDLPRRNNAIERSERTDYRVPEGEHPWKDTTPITRKDIDTFLSEGIANNPLLDFEPVAFSTDLVPARDLPSVAQSLQHRPAKPFGYNMRNVNRLHTWSEKPGDVIEFTSIPGTVYQTRGDVTFTLFSGSGLDTGQDVGEEAGEADEVPVDLVPADEVILPPDKEEHQVKLTADTAGQFFIRTNDSAGGFRVMNWTEDRPLTLDSSEEFMFNHSGRPDLVFYVPRGTKTLGIFTRGVGTIFDADNKPVYEMDGAMRHASIAVAEGMDGKFWRFVGLVGARIQLLTVPPFMAPTAAQLLLPREVVEADSVSNNAQDAETE